MPYKDQQSGKISSKPVESLEILEVKSREDLIEEWLALNPKDVIDFNRDSIKKITTKVTITFDFGKEECLLAFQPLK
ncbi:MAG: hypothetical protein KGI10_07835 [Thaumarchaeota archaeon]|nr:hypothetical protein [Nitrososphaerota archaeon]